MNACTFFSVDYDSIDIDGILVTHKYLMKKIKYCLDLLKNVFSIIKFWRIISSRMCISKQSTMSDQTKTYPCKL